MIPIVPTLTNTVPGWATPSQLALIEYWAKEIPKNGIVVEIGSFAGRSAWHWAKSVDPSVTVYAIDSWDTDLYNSYRNRRNELSGNNIENVECSIEQFLENTKDCNNIVAVKARSPDIPTDIAEKLTAINCVYIDDSHVNPEFENNFNFWKSRLVPGGIFCGDDFVAHYVYSTVVKSMRTNKYTLYARDNFWRLYPWEETIEKYSKS